MKMIAIAAFAALFASRALAVDVTTCALPGVGGPLQTVPEGQTAVLQADLSGCRFAVALEDDATLLLNGHTISDCGVFAALCLGRRCTIEGPGEITGRGCNIYQETLGPLTRMTVRNLDMHDTWGSVGGERMILTLENVTVTGQLANPNSEEETNTLQHAVSGYRVTGTNVTITDNIGWGLGSYRRPKLTNSTITGNNGNGGGYDVASKGRPRFENVTCGRSFRLTTGETWGVCAND